MPTLPALLAIAVISGDSLELRKVKWEEPQLRAEVDSAVPSVPACPQDRYQNAGWTRRSVGIEGISYATPPGFPKAGPYLGRTMVLGFATGTSSRLTVSWSREPELPSAGYWVGWHATKHDYSWCRERVDGREMLIVTQKVTTRGMGGPGSERSYIVWAVWPVREGIWLAFQGEATTPAAQREILAVIRTFRVDPNAPSRQLRFRAGSWFWYATQRSLPSGVIR